MLGHNDLCINPAVEDCIHKEMAGAVGFEPTIHDTKNRCLTTWPRPNLHGLSNLTIKSLAINPVLARRPSKMWLIFGMIRRIMIKRYFSSTLNWRSFVAFAQTPSFSNAAAIVLAVSISSKMPKQLAPLPDICAALHVGVWRNRRNRFFISGTKVVAAFSRSLPNLQ